MTDTPEELLQIQELKTRLRTQTGMTLIINNVPKSTYDRFRVIASEEDFNRNYAFALKFLVDFFDGMIPTGMEQAMGEIEHLKERIAVLEAKGNQPEANNVIRMANGRVIEGVNTNGKT